MDIVSQQDDAPVMVTGRRMRARLQSVRRTVQVGDLRMSVLDWMGPEQPVNPPVAILHGALQTAEGMANLASHLARRGRVVVPDLRGRGETAQPEDGYDPTTMATDVAGLIDQLAIDRPVVIGRLHGGLVAYHLAAEHPGSLSGLVIGDTLPEVTDGHARHLIEMTRSLPRSFPALEDAYAFYQYQLGLSLERALHDIPFDLRRARGGYTWRHNLDLVARIEEAALPRADWHVLERIEAPTLILRGQRGMLSEDMAGRMRDAIGDCSVQMILASGRDVFLGGGAEQAFAAIDLFLLRLTDTGLPRSVPTSGAMHARAVIEPLVRALNGHDAEAVRALVVPEAEIEVIHDGQPVQRGDGALLDAVLGEVLASRPAAVFAIERFLASRREASAVLVSRARPVAGAEEAASDSLSVSLWFDVEGQRICAARIQIAHIPG